MIDHKSVDKGTMIANNTSANYAVAAAAATGCQKSVGLHQVTQIAAVVRMRWQEKRCEIIRVVITQITTNVVMGCAAATKATYARIWMRSVAVVGVK